MTTTERTRIRLGNQLWKEPEDGSENFRDAYQRLTGVTFSHSAVIDEELVEGDGTYMLMPSGMVIWVSHDSSEIFAPCLPDPEPIVDEDGEAVDQNLGRMLAEFVDLTKQKRDLEEQLKGLEKLIAALQEPLAEQMGLSGMQNAKVDGFTVYKKTNRYVSKGKGIDTEAVCEALESLELGYMVKEGYHAGSLKSRVLEYEEAWQGMTDDQRTSLAETHTETGVPRTLAALLSIGETVTVEARKA